MGGANWWGVDISACTPPPRTRSGDSPLAQRLPGLKTKVFITLVRFKLHFCCRFMPFFRRRVHTQPQGQWDAPATLNPLDEEKQPTVAYLYQQIICGAHTDPLLSYSQQPHDACAGDICTLPIAH